MPRRSFSKRCCARASGQPVPPRLSEFLGTVLRKRILVKRIRGLKDVVGDALIQSCTPGDHLQRLRHLSHSWASQPGAAPAGQAPSAPWRHPEDDAVAI